jgi:succinoglycan biosynthesis protein ExoA
MIGASRAATTLPEPEQPHQPPLVSLIIPCRDEGEYIGRCLQSILANDYARDRLEVLVVDGGSTDGTLQILRDIGATDSRVRILSNAARITPAALNVGVRAARGTVIMRMDAHAHVPADYIRRSVEALFAYGADNVGGIIHTVPRRSTLLGRAIAACLSNEFGIGNSYSRTHVSNPVWFPALFGGCYRVEVFERVGLFDERLVRTEDLEFNLRLQRLGGRGLLVPWISSTYYARSGLGEFLRHTYGNGVWATMPFAYSSIVPVSLRQVVPLGFVLTLTALFLSATVTDGRSADLVLALILATYAIASCSATVSIGWRRRDWALLPVLPFLFAGFHLTYGLGSLWGAVQAIGVRSRAVFFGFWNSGLRAHKTG